MSYGEAKVYFDGSHYIAIPHTTRNLKRSPKPQEEMITVVENELKDSTEDVEPSISLDNTNNINDTTLEILKSENKPKQVREITKKELFNELYCKYIDLKKKDRKKVIVEEMLPYFKDKQSCIDFVSINFDRKQRNLICRRVRMVRKANLINFNYFCTFTYDDKKHTEASFKKKLRTAFRHLCERRNWKYMGVWERAPKTRRLHFHGLFLIPENAMVGEIKVVRDYNFNTHKMQETCQNTYFNNRFGRSDFEKINKHKIGEAIQYLIKYIEKTEEKIVYSKGLYQYFISDIMDDDVVCTIGQEDRKLLLFDNFNCWDEGCLIGKVSSKVIQQMRKCN
ncbi:MAG: hypothetical protein IKT27_02610 [Clostridia bacterium]|nr:hypothetical protein [Clostridia bacterium]